MNYQTFVDKYGIRLNVLDYSSLVNSIPRIWKSILKGSNIHQTDENKDYVAKLLASEKVCNKVYWRLIENVGRYTTFKAKEKWASLAGIWI